MIYVYCLDKILRNLLKTVENQFAGSCQLDLMNGKDMYVNSTYDMNDMVCRLAIKTLMSMQVLLPCMLKFKNLQSRI